MKRLFVAVVLSAIACSVAFAKSGTFSVLASTGPSLEISSEPYTNETEALVSEIAGSILHIAAAAGHFDPGEPFQVRNVGTPDRPRFRVTRRGEVFTVAPARHVWEPGSYVALARSFLVDGAGPSITEDAASDGALQDHPRSALLHEQAAFAMLNGAADYLAAAKLQRAMCRATAHLAVAQALHGAVRSDAGRSAERSLTLLAEKQTIVP